MLRVLPVLLLVGLTVYATIDCLLTERARVRHLPRPAWVVAILAVPLAGPLAWLSIGRKNPRPSAGRGPARPLAPDDDPDFLRRLSRPDPERRHPDGRRLGPDDDGDGPPEPR